MLKCAPFSSSLWWSQLYCLFSSSTYLQMKTRLISPPPDQEVRLNGDDWEKGKEDFWTLSHEIKLICPVLYPKRRQRISRRHFKQKKLEKIRRKNGALQDKKEPLAARMKVQINEEDQHEEIRRRWRSRQQKKHNICLLLNAITSVKETESNLISKPQDTHRNTCIHGQPRWLNEFDQVKDQEVLA